MSSHNSLEGSYPGSVALTTSQQVHRLTHPITEPYLNDDFDTMAGTAGLITQRKADEMQAGREFSDALDWINWTESFKGQRSGEDFRVQMKDQSGLALYIQTREYHMTGGELLAEQQDGSWGCEEIVSVRGKTATYATDMYRAETMKSIGKKLERRSTRSSLLSTLATSFETVSSVPTEPPEEPKVAQTLSVAPDSVFSTPSDIGARFRVMTLMSEGMSEEEASRPRPPHRPRPRYLAMWESVYQRCNSQSNVSIA